MKNRKSNKDFGTVRLITENGSLLEKRTKIMGRFGRKSDYADGDIVVKADLFNNLNLNEFTTKYLLGQDKIDSFLRSFSPKDRYDTLTNFWDNANDSDLFKRLLGMNRESEKKLHETKKLFNEINVEIQNLIIRPNIISEINNLVSKFNQLQLRDLVIPQFEPSKSNHFVNSLIEINSMVELISTENENQLLISSYLVENYIIFSTRTNELNDINGNITVLNLVLNQFKNRYEKSQFLQLVFSDLYDLNKKYQNLKKLESQYHEYEKIQKTINDLEEANQILIKNTSTLAKINVQEEQKIKHIENDLRNVKEKKSELEKQYSNLDKNLLNYSSLKVKKAHFTKRSKQIQELIDTRWKKIEEIKKETLTLKSYTKYDIENIINIHFSKQRLNSIIKEIRDRFNNIAEKENELKELENEYIEFGKLSEKLNTIYKVGKNFIEESHSITCPLCKKEYEDFQTLIRKVDQDFFDVESLNKLISDIDNLRNIVKEEENKSTNLMTEFKKSIDSEIGLLSMMSIVQETKITSYNSLYQRINNKLHGIELDLNNLNNFFERLNINIESKDLVYLTNIKSSIAEKIFGYENESNNLIKQINGMKEEQKKLLDKLNEKEIEFNSNKIKIREFSEDPIRKKVNVLLEELKIDNNINAIINERKRIKQMFIIQANNKRLYTEQINSLNKELEGLIQEDLMVLIDEKRLKLNEIQDYIDNYKIKASKLLKGDTFLETDIQQLNNELKNYKRVIQKGLTFLNELMGYSKYIENHITSETKESKKKELEEEIIILEQGNKEIYSAKELVSHYIENKINNTFNLDSINSIYQRIDPHPDFNNIKFETDFTKDKPELHIYASSNQEKLAPILYFSSAQVNILSLSIFLARALIEEHEGLNTIFMDDPIQHLDNLNILSFIDLLRTITVHLDKQVILSTHNENFYKLIKRKMDPEFTNSKFIELESFGKIKTSS
mgnify:CR=1 FL=1